MTDMFVDDIATDMLVDERDTRRSQIKQQRKEKRAQQISQRNKLRKQSAFYPLVNRIRNLNSKTRKQLLKAKTQDFISSINDLLEAPDFIFPDVPVESPFMASPTGMSKDELAILKRLRKLQSPGAPNISPIDFTKSPEEVYISDEELEERRLTLLNPVIAGGPVTFY